MLQKDISEKEGKLFTGRQQYLKQLEEKVSKKSITAVIAPSGFGRTTLLRQFAAKSSAFYIDLKKISIPPENFAVELIGTVCFLHLAKDRSELSEFMSIEKLRQLKLGKACEGIISTVDNELQKIKPDQELLVKSAFGFAEEFAAEHRKKSAFILDSFDELLKLDNFSQIKDTAELFFTTASKSKSCQFIVSSSAVNLLRSITKKYSIDTVEISPLSQDETKELFEKIAGRCDERIAKEVYRLSSGLPLIVRSMASRFRDGKTSDVQKDLSLLKYILVSELADTTSRSYFYCSSLFTGSLDRARGESLLKAALKQVSQNRPLRLTEIARLIYRSGPVTKSLLERLVEVDLITKAENTFDFSNPVLKLWCRLMFSDIEFDGTPDVQQLKSAGAGGLL
jgi:hypothetical protein